MQPVDPNLITSVTFPEEGDTQITISADAIRYQRSVEGTYSMLRGGWTHFKRCIKLLL